MAKRKIYVSGNIHSILVDVGREKPFLINQNTVYEDMEDKELKILKENKIPFHTYPAGEKVLMVKQEPVKTAYIAKVKKNKKFEKKPDKKK